MGGRTTLLASLVLAMAGLGFGGSASAATAPPRCDLGKFAELPVSMRGSRPVVNVRIDGAETPFTVASGSFFSIMNKPTVERLKLSTRMAPFGYSVRGAGGTENRVDVATVKRFGLGVLEIPDVIFLELPEAENGTAGLLGQNVLSLFDTEYDIGNGMLRLMKPSEACRSARDGLAYWAGDKTVSMVDVEPINPEQRHLRGAALINGQKIKVIFDTGASSSILKRSTAERLGFRVDGPGVEARGAIRGIGPRALEVWTAPFDLIDIGGEKISHTRIQVADLDALGADMLLGIDFFLSHRLYVSKQQRKIYFTYNGGPVFRLEPKRGPQVAEAPPSAAGPTSSTAPNPYADSPGDAAAFVRRAEASMARRDYPAAVADFGKAIELEPTAQHYVQRATAHAAAGEAVLAMADYDEALKMRPGLVAALVGRGRLYMLARDYTRAQSDLDAAVRADPESARAVATIYANNQRYEAAIADMDLWIGRHPQSETLASALGERCRIRVLWNHDLDRALADCEAAIKKGPVTAELFETRGLAHLRRNELDAAIADEERALKLQPRLGWALMGRGLAKKAKGDTAGGDADVAAATAIQPNLATAVKRLGLAPA